MKQELELYFVGCNDDEMQRFIRFVSDMSFDALSLIYDECGPVAKRRIAENSTTRVKCLLDDPKDRVLTAENYPEIEEKCLQYFKSEDFREYRDLKVKSVLDVMKTMRKKGFPEKYISTFRLARYIDKDKIYELIHKWFEIFLLEESLGLPMDTIMPVFMRKDSYCG